MPAPTVCHNPSCGALDSFIPSDGYVTCSSCGLVDEAQTAAVNYRSTYDGYDVGDDFRAYGHAWSNAERDRARADEKFKDEIKARAVDWLYGHPNILGLSSVDHPLGPRDASHPFIRSVMSIYQQIRYKETFSDNGKGKHQLFKETINSSTRRAPYHLAVAIRFAALQNNLLLAYSVLGTDGDETFPASLKGERAVLGNVLPLPLLKDMVDNMQPSSLAGENPIGEHKYLYRTHRLFLRLLKRPSDPLYSMLSNCHLIIQRLRGIVACTTAETLAEHLRQNRKTSKALREWHPEDFAYLRDHAEADQGMWDKVLRVAYHLYRAQQCVMLWGSSISYVYAVSLTLTAAYGVVGSTYPYNSALYIELCAQYGASHWTAQTAMNSLRRMIVAWTNSFITAGVEIPHLNLPPKGLVGEGMTGWNGDARRKVPENEIWVVGIEPVAMNWRKIQQSRLRNRSSGLPYDQELLMARTMFAQNTPDGRSKSRAKQGLSARALLLAQYAKQAQQEGSTTPASGSATPAESEEGWELDDDPNCWFNHGPTVQDQAPNPEWYPTILAMPDSASSTATSLPAGVEDRYRALEKRTAETELQDLLARQDSSDEEDGWSSDEGERPSRGLGLKGVDARKGDQVGPWAALVTNPNGFYMREKAAMEVYEEELYDNHAQSYSPTSSRSDYGSEAVRNIRRGSSTSSHLGVPRPDRLPSPAASASTLHSLGSAIRSAGSAAMSRTSSIGSEDELRPIITGNKHNFTPKPSRAISELDSAKEHIASLIRERDEFLPYRSHNERVTGRLVSKPIEAYMNEWLGKLRAKGAMPKKISWAYLASIGLAGKNPMVDDLSTWILTQQWRWSPLECVLRAGIKPRQLPVWMVPHSKIGVIRTLEHHTAFEVFPAAPEFPVIPDRYKADPRKFRREIQALRDAWEKDVSDGFPVFFPHHEKFFVNPGLDDLFVEGEYDDVLADEEEIEERKADKDFMHLINGLDDDGEPWDGGDTEEKKKKRERKSAVDNQDKSTGYFPGYEAALENDEDAWLSLSVKMVMGDGRYGDYGDEEDPVEDDDHWGSEDDEDAEEMEAEMAWAGKGKRKGTAAPRGEARKRQTDVSPVVPQAAKPAPKVVSRASSVSSNATVRPSPPIPLGTLPSGATLNSITQPPVATSSPVAPASRLPVGMDRLLDLEASAPVLPQVDYFSAVSNAYSPSTKRARPVESPDLPDPAKRVKAAAATKDPKLKPSPRAPGVPKPSARAEELAIRKELATKRAFSVIKHDWYEAEMKAILLKVGFSMSAVQLATQSVKVGEHQARFDELRAERDKCAAFNKATRKETTSMVPNKVLLKEQVAEWGKARSIPLHRLGWSKI